MAGEGKDAAGSREATDPSARRDWEAILHVALWIGGIASIAAGRMLPVFKVDYLAAQQQWRAICPAGGDVDPAAYEAFTALYTDRYPLQNIGVSLILLSITLLVLGLRPSFGTGSAPWRSPENRGVFVATGVIGLFLILFGWMLGLGWDFNRYWVPPCADAALRSAAIGGVILAVILFVVGVVGWLVARSLPRHAVPLFRGREGGTAHNLPLAVLAMLVEAFALAFILIVMGSEYLTLLPGLLVTFYLAESVRSVSVSVAETAEG